METPKMGSLTDINTDINTHKEYSTASKLTVSNQKNKPVLRNEDITKKLLSFLLFFFNSQQSCFPYGTIHRLQQITL